MKPYYRKDGICILNGHVLDILKKLPSESIQCVVTSPPYWGLRDYGLEPQIWDDPGGCKHEWGNKIKSISCQGYSDKLTLVGFTNPNTKGRQLDKAKESNKGQFCQICGVWKGSLGLEPTPELYVQHLVQIFHEVKRVLRKDGTCWLNLGDSYAGSGKGQMGSGVHAAKHGEKQHTNKGTLSGGLPTDYAGLKQKDLVGIPWRIAFALQLDSWYLRSDIIWEKPNCMPESVKDRPTRSHEYIFLLSKSKKYYYENEAIKEQALTESQARYARGKSTNHKYADGGPGNQTVAKSLEHMKYRSKNSPRIHGNLPGRSDGGKACNKPDQEYRNKRSVWTIATQPFKGAHFATFPEEIPRLCISAGCPEGGIVLDPFMGSGRTLIVAKRLKRRAIGIELNPEYYKMPLQALADEDG